MHTVSGGVVLFCLLHVGGPLGVQEHLSVPDRTPAARLITSSLAAGNFAAVVERFDSAMQRAMPELKLAETWDALVGQVGAFSSQGQAILQGGRDYQVTMEDFHGWEAVLSDRAYVRLRVFPSLNHLFLGGEGTPDPAEYQSPGHVALEVIEEITAWIRP